MSLLEDAVMTGKVKAALLLDERIGALGINVNNEHLLDVHIAQNTVFLSGRQGDVDAHNAAVEIAAHIPGVVAVEDDIEIMPAV